MRFGLAARTRSPFFREANGLALPFASRIPTHVRFGCTYVLTNNQNEVLTNARRVRAWR